jgi:hypothetical protein
MKKIATTMRLALLFIFLLGVGILLVSNYGFVFSHDVRGEIIAIERFTAPTTSPNAPAPAESSNPQNFSFAIAVKDGTGEIFHANSEDRQWALAKPGFCVEARFYPYPPWNLERSGTFANVRLTKLMECPGTGVGATTSPPPVPQ